MSREIVEGILLDRLEAASPKEAQDLLECLRFSGLLDARVHEVRTSRGWRRHKALLALGRMRVAEAIPALTEGFDDAEEECRIAAHARAQEDTGTSTRCRAHSAAAQHRQTPGAFLSASRCPD